MSDSAPKPNGSTAAADADAQTPSADILASIYKQTREQFLEKQRILSFEEYFELVLQQPQRQARSIAQYLRDCFDYFGHTDLERPWGDTRRYRLFDCPWDNGDQRLIGQEDAQASMYRLLTNFIQEGRIQRLILLHGPNGSAKSSLIGCLMRALEAYSMTDEGALYTFNWIFPTDKISRGLIGFGGRKGEGASFEARPPGHGDSKLNTYAYLDDASIDAKIANDLRDHPLMLLAGADRASILDQRLENKEKSFILSDYLRRGELSHMSKQIFEALLTAYQGDIKEVLRHVQIERFFISRRYRVGAITVEPQLRVDAGSRAISVDRSFQSLPASVQNQTLFEPFGDLVDGNRGIIEYNDLLKRQSEYNKYLLATSEKGTVSLEHSILFLDAVLVGSANEMYLDAFKTTPDYPSFKARLELVRMPYILDYLVEQRIYQEQISTTEIGKPILPHTAAVAALWAVLTRLNRPKIEGVPDELKDTVKNLTPLQKAELYARGLVPDDLSLELSRSLKTIIPELMVQGADSSAYEGRTGASPREMKTIILNAAQTQEFPHLSPLAVFEELKALVRDPSVYTFLQMKPDGLYHRPADFIEAVTEWYLEVLDQEVRTAMGLVEESQYTQFFERYIDNVTHLVRGEKLYNKATGRYEEPDEDLMSDVETRIGAPEPVRPFREDIMTTIAAWSLDHPGKAINYSAIFPGYLEALKNAYFDERLDQIRKLQQNLLSYIDQESDNMTVADIESVERTLARLQEEFGYTRPGAREVVVFLLQRRYSD